MSKISTFRPTVDFMLSPPLPPWTLSLAKKGREGDLESHFDLQAISAKKKGGEDLARHIFLLVKIVCSNRILINRAKCDFGTQQFLR